MNKQATEPTNSMTRLPIPLIGDINNRRFVTAILSGVIGGAGVSAAANLLRSYKEMRKKHNIDETDDETIVLTLPNNKKAAEDAYTSMRNAKSGESKITTNGSRQFRDAGKYGKGVAAKTDAKASVKCADGNPGPNTVGTIVANFLGLTAGGLMSYDVVSRLFDEMNERKLKRKLKAAQESYVNAMTGASKRAEMITRITDPVEHVLFKGDMSKEANAADVIRYPVAAYILALLAGTGATAYVTKKVMDREFPEEKLKKDINRPTRIVFRTAGTPELLEGERGKEKRASAETCAAITAMLPIYMDIVEGAPNRTLSEPYVKIAEAANTDARGLMKIAEKDYSEAFKLIFKDPRSIWEILKGTRFGLDFFKLDTNSIRRRIAGILRDTRPEIYRQAVDSMIDTRFRNTPNDGFIRRKWNDIQRWYTNRRGRDWAVDKALTEMELQDAAKSLQEARSQMDRHYGSSKPPAVDTASEATDPVDLTKSSSLSDILGSDTVMNALKEDEEQQETMAAAPDSKSVMAKAKQGLKGKHKLSIEARDRQAAKFIKSNKELIRRLLIRMNARGTI